MQRSNSSVKSAEQSATTNGHSINHSNTSQDLIDDDIHHTVGRLFQVRPQQNNLTTGRKDSLEEIVQNALQAERNHWKQRLHLSMQEIDRQHKVSLAVQAGLQVCQVIINKSYMCGYI